MLRALALLGRVATGNVPLRAAVSAEGAASWQGPAVTHSRLLCEFITNIWGGEGKEKLYCDASQGTCVGEP